VFYIVNESIFVPPKNLEEWSISTIDSLVEQRYPELDALDFKEKMPDDFEKDICAFANSGGGFVVFGISGKDKAEVKRPLSDEHNIIQKLTGKMALIDPTPIISTKKIEDGVNFYLVLEIKNSSHLKPFSVKNPVIFYIRFNGSSQPASKTVILNLFSDSIGRRQKLTVL